MIKLFRHLRLSLFAGEKFTAYIKYSIGEIILVVIGILIALQINNWNEQIKKQTSLKLVLTNLVENLQQDQAALKQMQQLESFRFHAFIYLLKMAGASSYDAAQDGHTIPPYKNDFIWKSAIPENYDKKFITEAFLWSHRSNMVAANQAAINELKNTGMYSSINDKNLKIAITNYYNAWNIRIRGITEDLINDWQKSLESDGVITSDVAGLKDPIVLLKDHPERIALIKRLIRESAWWIESADVLSKNAEKLIEVVQKYISTQ